MAIYVLLLCVTVYTMCYVTRCSKLTAKYLYTLISLDMSSGFVLKFLFPHMIKSNLGKFWSLPSNMKIETTLWHKKNRKKPIVQGFDLQWPVKPAKFCCFSFLYLHLVQRHIFWWHNIYNWMSIDKYITNFVTRIQCYRLWHMRYPTLKKTLQKIFILQFRSTFWLRLL